MQRGVRPHPTQLVTQEITAREHGQQEAEVGGRDRGTMGTERLIQSKQDRVEKRHRKQKRERDPGRVAGRD